jgi:hypothetical protein
VNGALRGTRTLTSGPSYLKEVMSSRILRLCRTRSAAERRAPGGRRYGGRGNDTEEESSSKIGTGFSITEVISGNHSPRLDGSCITAGRWEEPESSFAIENAIRNPLLALILGTIAL